MGDEIEIEGVKYISSKRASGLSGYAQDYIGQLARKGLIHAQRIGGLWYVSFPSLESYKAQAETYKPQPPKRIQASDPDSLISFDGKDHVSAARAAEITGYHQDYVGQLARSGTVLSRQVGNRWYVEREAILKHKREKDRILAAVQTESVGLARASMAEGTVRAQPDTGQETSESAYAGAGPYLTYTREDGESMPHIEKSLAQTPTPAPQEEQVSEDAEEYMVPIRVMHNGIKRHSQFSGAHQYGSGRPKTRRTAFYGALAASALTIVIVLTLGISTLKDKAIYAVNLSNVGTDLDRNALTAGVGHAIDKIGDVLESWLAPELVYKSAE